MPTLTPNVENVAGLVLDMMDGTWPTSDDDRQVFYSSHGLTQVASSAGEALRREHGRTLMHQFETSLPGVYGIDTMFRDEFLGLSFVRLRRVRRRWSRIAGGVSVTQGSSLGSAWCACRGVGHGSRAGLLLAVRPLQTEMYCFQRLPSGVMVGPSHVARSAAYDHEAARTSG